MYEPGYSLSPHYKGVQSGLNRKADYHEHKAQQWGRRSNAALTAGGVAGGAGVAHSMLKKPVHTHFSRGAAGVMVAGVAASALAGHIKTKERRKAAGYAGDAYELNH